MQRAILTLDSSILLPEDLPALLTCMPSAEEGEQLNAHVSVSGTDGLSTADDFLWRMLQIPRVQPRLTAFAVATTSEASGNYLSRQLDLIATGCEQATASIGLRSALGVVLAIGNTLNDGNTLRGGAIGFGLEALATLMSVRSTQGSDATLMHFIVEQLTNVRGGDGTPLTATSLRNELKRVPEAAMIDVEDLRREIVKLEREVMVMGEEVRIAGDEAGLINEEEGGGEPRAMQLRAWRDEPLPEELLLGSGGGGEGGGGGLAGYYARRAVAILDERLHGCMTLCSKLKGRIEEVDDAYKSLEVAFGEGAVVTDGGSDRVAGGGGNVHPARQILIELSNFIAAFEKAEKDNTRRQGLAATLRKLRNTGGGGDGSPRATPPLNSLTSPVPPPPSSSLPPPVVVQEPPPPQAAAAVDVSLASSWNEPLMEESRLFPSPQQQAALYSSAPPAILGSRTMPGLLSSSPPALSPAAKALLTSPGEGSGGGGCPTVRRSSSYPVEVVDSAPLIEQAERLLSRPRGPSRRSRAAHAGGGEGGSGTASSSSSQVVSPAVARQASSNAYASEEEYF